MAAKTESNFIMEENRKYDWRMEVRNAGIRIFVDNELVCAYVTDYHEFVVSPSPADDLIALGISAWWNKIVIYKAEVTELGRPGTILHTGRRD